MIHTVKMVLNGFNITYIRILGALLVLGKFTVNLIYIVKLKVHIMVELMKLNQFTFS